MPSSETTWALLPVKPLQRSKRRLTGLLDEAERRELARLLFEHTLRCLVHGPGGASGPGLDGVVVVTSDREVATAASRAGARLVDDPGGGLNPALEAARRAARRNDADRLLVLPADLPLLTGAALDRLLRAPEGRQEPVTLVPDPDDGGTNALLLPADLELPFLYGPDSARRHREAALGLGHGVDVVSEPSLVRAFWDLDGPDDLERLAPWVEPIESATLRSVLAAVAANAHAEAASHQP